MDLGSVPGLVTVKFSVRIGVIVNLCNSSTIIAWLINVFLFPVGRET